MTLGDVFKQARKKAGYTVLQLCIKADVSKSYYTKIENNKYFNMNYETALRIAIALGLDKEVIDRYYNIPSCLDGNVELVSNNGLIEQLQQQEHHVLNIEEKQLLILLMKTAVETKKKGLNADDMIEIMTILKKLGEV